MGLFIALVISTLISAGGSTVAVKAPAVSAPTQSSLPPVCLDESTAKNGIDPGTDKIPKVLKNIKRPTRENVTQGYEIPMCQNIGNCDGPDTADYILVATNVQTQHVVYPNNYDDSSDVSDRQLVKQTDITSDTNESADLRNRVYRTYCGDWCDTCPPDQVVCADDACLKGSCTTSETFSLPFRGSFHCDFIFYLSDTDSLGRLQIDKTGSLAAGKINETLPELPADGSIFNVYMRVGAKIPDVLTCPVTPTNQPTKVDLRAGQKSLKLSTFFPTTNWIKKWAQESKPAIYLYPKEKTQVNVKLHPAGYLTVSDPPYDPEKGWEVTAYPDGTISDQDTSNNHTFPYLYYEAQIDKIPKVTKGFIVEKDKISTFLSEKLKKLGLNEKELKDYLEYWLPRLNKQTENYFLVYFLTPDEIEEIEPLSVSMKFDTEIRIRTYFKPLQEPIDISPQTLEKPLARSGNILVEWGGILDQP